MKNKWFSSAKILLLGTAFAGAMFITSCDKNDDNKPANSTYTISGSGTGAQVVPAFTGTGTGTLSGTYNKETNRLDYNVGWTGLTDTASTVGFFTGASGSEGVSAQSLSVSTQGTTGTSVGFLTLTDAQETDLLAGKWYYSVGTLANSNGEVRGQVTTAQ